MRQLTHLSLFSGIGGLDLAAEMAGFTTVGQCEWADFPTKVLEKHWPDVPRWRDIRTLTKESFCERTGLRTVDVISGGFPCQPHSLAGKRKGADDERHLWPEFMRVVRELNPRYVVGENVAGIVNLALDTVLSDLEGIGYTCEALVFPACAVDAPHRRDRVCIVAYCKICGVRGLSVQPRGSQQANIYPIGSCKDVANSDVGTMRNDGKNIRQVDGEINAPDHAGIPCAENVSHTNSNGLEEPWVQGLSEKQGIPTTDRNWRSAQSGLGGVDDGLSHWLDAGLSSPGHWLPDPFPMIPRIAKGIKDRVNRLKSLGNAVVPQQFYPVFQVIGDFERVVAQ